MRQRVAALRGGYWWGAEILKMGGQLDFGLTLRGLRMTVEHLFFHRGRSSFSESFCDGTRGPHIPAAPSRETRSEKKTIREWNIMFRWIRFTGPVGIAFPGTEQVPEGSINSLLREALAEKNRRESAKTI